MDILNAVMIFLIGYGLAIPTWRHIRIKITGATAEIALLERRLLELRLDQHDDQRSEPPRRQF